MTCCQVPPAAAASAIGMGRRSRGAFPDEAEATVDCDVAFVAEDRQGDLRQGLACLVEPDLAADLQSPASVGILLGRLVRLVRPDLIGAPAGLDRLLLGIIVTLLGRGNQGSVDDLARHREVALLLQLPVEGLHHPPQGAGLGEFVTEQANGVLVWRRATQIELQKPHPGEPVPDHELHLRVGEIVLGLKDQRLEHRHRIEGRSATLGAIAVAQALNEPAAEIFEVDRRLENLQRITDLADPLEMLRQSEKRPLIHRPSPEADDGRSESRNQKQREVIAGVQLKFIYELSICQKYWQLAVMRLCGGPQNWPDQSPLLGDWHGKYQISDLARCKPDALRKSVQGIFRIGAPQNLFGQSLSIFGGAPLRRCLPPPSQAQCLRMWRYAGARNQATADN